MNITAIEQCKYCSPDLGIQFDTSNFADRIKNGNETPHRFHYKKAEEPSILKLKKYYDLIAKFRIEQGIYPNEEILEDEGSNIGYCRAKLQVGENMLDFGLTSVSTDRILQNFFDKSNKTFFANPPSIENWDILTQIINNCKTVKIINNAKNTSFGSGILDEVTTIPFFHKENLIVDRRQDTEFRFLEYIAQSIFEKLDINWSEMTMGQIQLTLLKLQNIEGEIEIFTERRVCESCARAFELFGKIFPKIKIVVIEGFGDNINYSETGIEHPKSSIAISNLRKKIAFAF